MSDFRSSWFEEDDDESFLASVRPEPSSQQTTNLDEYITGQDPDGVVTIGITDDGNVGAARLTSVWRSSVAPSALHTNVLAAMNAATVSAMNARAEQAGEVGSEPAGPIESSAPSQSADDSPITTEDAMRLIESVTADLDQFMQQVSDVADQTITAESSGGYVSVTGKHRQATNVAIDSHWVGRARDTEIENELFNALSSFTSKSSLGELAQGPQSTNVNELRRLVRDPEALIRRISSRNL